MSERRIDVAAEFTPRPFGRYKDDGERSAAVFRDDILIPAILENDRVVVDLSGSNLYGPSFLEETFGGLIRAGISSDIIHSRLVVIHKKLPSVEIEVGQYITTAEKSAG